jgi:hypothetical protein
MDARSLKCDGHQRHITQNSDTMSGNKFFKIYHFFKGSFLQNV